MTMRGASHRITICDTIRKINDLHQTDSELDLKTRKLCTIAEKMGKRMDAKLREYSMKYDKDWWKKNPRYKEDVERRLDPNYRVEE